MTSSSIQNEPVIQSVEEFISWAIANTNIAPNEDIWWRGHSMEHWPLVPDLYRYPRNASYEELAFNEFCRVAPARASGLPSKDDKIEWLQLMRHHGLPTRMLDWSTAALVALLFAVTPDRIRIAYSTATEVPADGRVWYLHPAALNELGKHGRVVSSASSPGLKDHLSHGLSPSMWLIGKQTSAILAKDKSGAPPEPPKTIAYLGKLNHARLASQHSAFTLHADGMPLERSMVSSDVLGSIRVAGPSKTRITNELRMLGVTWQSIFPDLDGLSSDLSRVDFLSPRSALPIL